MSSVPYLSGELPVLNERQRREARYHDWLVQRKRWTNADLLVPDEATLFARDLGYSLRYCLDVLGDLRGQRVLEIGCGTGLYSVILARRGAQVTAIDISPASVELTCCRAKFNGVGPRLEAHWMAAERLDFREKAFDWVIGFGVLHHVDVAATAGEGRRVLCEGGRALFREPLGSNPLLRFIRRYVPYRQKGHSPEEQPLSYGDIALVGRHFRAWWTREFYLLSMISRAVGCEQGFPWLTRLDETLLARFPVLRRLCRYVVLLCQA